MTSDEEHSDRRAKRETSALYVRLPTHEAQKLDRAAFELKAHKRDLIAALVARYVDPSSESGLARLRELEAYGRRTHEGEIPVPGPRAAPVEPVVRISRASEWVAGLQRSIRDFVESTGCSEPFVRVTLDDGEQLFLATLKAGPDDDFVTIAVHEAGDELPALAVVRLGAIRKVEILQRAPAPRQAGFVFQPRETGVGFA